MSPETAVASGQFDDVDVERQSHAHVVGAIAEQDLSLPSSSASPADRLIPSSVAISSMVSSRFSAVTGDPLQGQEENAPTIYINMSGNNNMEHLSLGPNSENDTLTESLISSAARQPARPRVWKSVEFRVILFLLLLLVSVATVASARGHFTRRREQVLQDRITWVMACTKALSEGEGFDSEDTPQVRAAKWLVEGNGQNVPLPDSCSKSSEFAFIYAIAVLKESVGFSHPKWESSVVRTLANDVCRWPRLGCDTNPDNNAKHITRIHFNQANLKGTIPKELGLLSPSLRCLDLTSNTELVGTIPSELGSLTAMDTLWLHHTGLTGTIPITMGQMKEVTQVLLDHTDLSGSMPSEVCALRRDGKLESLHASCTGYPQRNIPKLTCDKPSCCTECSLD